VTARTAIRVLVGAIAVGLIVVRFLVIDSTSHSNSDTLRPWVIESAIIVVVAWLVVRVADRVLDRPSPGS
jgi:hypothetical protein